MTKTTEKTRTNLKLFRVSAGMTQAEIAAAVGCARSTYALIEEGSRDGRVDFWNRLQTAFNVPSEKMFDLMKCGKE